MKNIKIIDNLFIERNTSFVDLIGVLKDSFNNAKTLVPMRHHHDFPNPEVVSDSTLLLMPAWNPGNDAGVKIVTVSPENGKFDLPSIQGTYIYLDALKGNVKAIMDAKSLTAKRTAATSALASSFLSRKDSSSLLMIGTGALSMNLILAHASVRSITTVYVYGRDFKKAEKICTELSNEQFSLHPVKTIEEVISTVDIVSSATLSPIPLVLGKFLKPGQHIDLVGAYKKDSREADDEVITRSSVFIDTYQGGLKESGDILIPLNSGVLKVENIKADLFELSQETKEGRKSSEEITVFKSVGHASEDLAAATYIFDLFVSRNESIKIESNYDIAKSRKIEF
jgi:ornithine cyclodeaminase